MISPRICGPTCLPWKKETSTVGNISHQNAHHHRSRENDVAFAKRPTGCVSIHVRAEDSSHSTPNRFVFCCCVDCLSPSPLQQRHANVAVSMFGVGYGRDLPIQFWSIHLCVFVVVVVLLCVVGLDPGPPLPDPSAPDPSAGPPKISLSLFRLPPPFRSFSFCLCLLVEFWWFFALRCARPCKPPP